MADCAKVAEMAETRDRQLRAATQLSAPFWTTTQSLRDRLEELQTGLLLAEAPACESPTLTDQLENNDRAGEEIERAQAEVPFSSLFFSPSIIVLNNINE